jgi:hypothetical protein
VNKQFVQGFGTQGSTIWKTFSENDIGWQGRIAIFYIAFNRNLCFVEDILWNVFFFAGEEGGGGERGLGRK